MPQPAPWVLSNRAFVVTFLATLITFSVFIALAFHAAHAPSKFTNSQISQGHFKAQLGNSSNSPSDDKGAEGAPKVSPITDDDSNEHYSYCEADSPTAKFYTGLKNYTLLSVHLMHRHGDRTPTTFLPFGLEKDPWYCLPENTQITDDPEHKYMQRTTIYNPDGCAAEGYCKVNPFFPTFWPGNCSRGQLTPKGIHQLNNLGNNLGDIYIRKLKFLDADWKTSEKDIFVASTDVWRTQQSVTSLISGMFHAFDNLRIYTFPTEMETAVSNDKGCKKIKTLEDNIQSSPSFKQYLATAEHERTKFEAILGSPRIGDQTGSLFYYVDLFQARSCHKFPAVCKRSNSSSQESDAASSCVTQKMIDKMMVYGNAENRIWYRDHPLVFPSLARMRIGGFLLEVKRNLLLAINKDSGLDVIRTRHPNADSDPNLAFPPDFTSEMFKKKFIIYSAHDSSLAALLGAIHSQDMNWPPYASSFLFELWHDTQNGKGTLDDYHLRMIFNGKEVVTPWCKSGTCPVAAFLNYLDTTLGIVGGFEKYGAFSSDPKNAPPIWHYLQECWI
ncbi:hypothetical protein DSO57_1020134 [Entomophthora muscae]|uniref:Uncharacterized protein n=1 Tax=Entomophthora muscae TaxID=34485 RepID=A0ACC2TEI8_9FUNG|nr:hypothetical protein DSO57_1020134 [Entomophthora muscae]